MISVTVCINNRTIYHRSAVNISEKQGLEYGEGTQIYSCDDGKKISHKYEDGASKLAIKMLKNIKEE